MLVSYLTNGLLCFLVVWIIRGIHGRLRDIFISLSKLCVPWEVYSATTVLIHRLMHIVWCFCHMSGIRYWPSLRDGSVAYQCACWAYSLQFHGMCICLLYACRTYVLILHSPFTAWLYSVSSFFRLLRNYYRLVWNGV